MMVVGFWWEGSEPKCSELKVHTVIPIMAVCQKNSGLIVRDATGVFFCVHAFFNYPLKLFVWKAETHSSIESIQKAALHTTLEEEIRCVLCSWLLVQPAFPELFVPVQALKLFDNVGAILALWLSD